MASASTIPPVPIKGVAVEDLLRGRKLTKEPIDEASRSNALQLGRVDTAPLTPPFTPAARRADYTW